MEESKLTPTQEEEVKKVCSEASSEIGDTNLNEQGCVEFEVYMAITRLIVKLQVRFEKLSNDEYKDERRAALKADNLQLYSQITQKMLGSRQKVKRGVFLSVLS